MLGKYINQFMTDNELSVNEEFFIKDIPAARKQILKNKIAYLQSELNYFKRRLDEENNNDEKV